MARQTLVVDIDSSCLVNGDAARLTQVFVNLLNNAAKYGGSQGVITLSVARHGHQAVVTLRDTGIGIQAHMLERIFQLFEQADDARTCANGGLGIGLALARLVVRHHEGTITASSGGSGCGSAFVVRLPAYDAATESLPA
jgi:signal transduction histidine kinase